MELATLYIVRGQGFGSDFTPKLIASTIAIALVIWDWCRQRRTDYAYVFLVGTVLWACAELFLAIQGIRDMPIRILMGKPIGLPLSVLIQGMSEGAFVAVTGLFVGDRILNRSSRIGGFQLGVCALVAISASVVRSRQFLESKQAWSRRDVLDPRALTALMLMILIVIVFFVAYRAWRKRIAIMFFCMAAMAAVWTIMQVMSGGRWVEIDVAGHGYTHASPSITVAVLAFDAVVEIAFIYSSFLAIPVALRFLRNPVPLPRTPRGFS